MADSATAEPGGHRFFVTVLLAVLHAVAFAGASAPLDWWPLVFIAPVPLVWLAIGARSTRRAVLVVLVVQMLMWLFIQRWLVDVTKLGYPALALYLAGYGALFVWLIRRVGRHPGLRSLPMTLVVPAVWVGLECLRGELLLNGYAWYLLAHPAIGWLPLVQSADLFGTYFVSCLVAAGAGAVVDLLRGATGATSMRRAVGACVVVFVVYAGNLGYGFWRIGQTPLGGDGPRVLSIQTNLPQSNKMAWSQDAQERDVASFIALTRQGFRASGGADLIVWPETMLPVHGLEPASLEKLREWGQTVEWTFAESLRSLRAELNVPMLVGAASFVDLDVDATTDPPRWTWTAHYNSAYLLDAAPPYQRYDKFFLTPFGEQMPYISAWPWLEERMMALGAAGMTFTLDASPSILRPQVPWRGGSFRVATPICFEDTVPWLCRQMVYMGDGSKTPALINLSNDGWFGANDAGRATHVQIARFRCVENRVPMVRCANTGFSVSIDSAGKVLGGVGEGRYGRGRYGEPRRDGWLLSDLAIDERRTLYGRIGEIWPWLCLMLAALLAGATARGGPRRQVDAKRTSS